MAITSLGGEGATANKTAGTSIGHAYSASRAAGVIVLAMVAKDNTGTTDADHSEVTSVADDNGNTYSKVAEYTNGQGAADTGATISLWKCKLTNAVTTSHTVTANFGSVAAKVISLWSFSVGSGNDLELVSGSTQTSAVDVGGLASMSISGLASKEYLFVRAIAAESVLRTLTPTTNYTAFDAAATSGDAGRTNMNGSGEFRIVTATGETSAPTTGTSNDHAAIFVAFEETSPATGGKVKVWDGASWGEKPVMVYNGATWDEKPLKVYNGATWDLA